MISKVGWAYSGFPWYKKKYHVTLAAILDYEINIRVWISTQISLSASGSLPWWWFWNQYILNRPQIKACSRLQDIFLKLYLWKYTIQNNIDTSHHSLPKAAIYYTQWCFTLKLSLCLRRMHPAKCIVWSWWS